MISGEVVRKIQGLPQKRPMRYQFHLKHLLFFVTIVAVLLAAAKAAPLIFLPLAFVGYVAGVFGFSLSAAGKITRMLQDAWTKGGPDSLETPPIERFFITSACMVVEAVASVLIGVLGLVLGLMLLAELIPLAVAR